MSWPVVDFKDVLSDVSGGNIKTKQNEYAEAGKYPIVDQGQSLIGGFTDDDSRLCKASSPVIIFGDHTKALKFIDFPFCMGADGTKILQAKDGNDPKYLYYALHNVHVPEAGYSRHFKYLKAGKIPLPPLEEQKRIAQILDQADALRRLRTRALDKLNTLGQAIFHEMFGDPRHNPKGWPVVEFGLVVENRDSQRVPIKQADRDKRSGPYPYYGSVGIIDDIDDFRFEGEHLLVSEDGKHLQSRTRPIACIANGKFWVNNHAHVLRDNGRADLFFLRTFLETSSIENHISGIDQIKLNRKSMDKIPVPLPPRPDQDKFRAIVSSLENQRHRIEKYRDRAGTLFFSLQHRAFRGEL